MTDQQDHIELAAETLLGDLMQLVLDEIRAAPDVWPKLSQYKQDEVIGRVERRVGEAVRQCVQLIATKGRTAIPGVLESVTVKDGIKSVVKVSQTDPNRHELVDATGRGVIVIVADAQEFAGGTENIKSEPDQRDLDIGRVDIVEPEAEPDEDIEDAEFRQLVDEADRSDHDEDSDPE